MFDIGFWELLLVAVVALVIVGPERFPGMIKKAGYWLGQFRRIVNSVKSEIKTEVDKADQLQNLLDDQKEILNRNLNIDITQPAVKPKTADSNTAETAEPRKVPDVPRPIETAVMRAEKEAAASASSSSENSPTDKS